MDAGARDAAVRRQVAVRQEVLAREENLAYFAAYVRGHSPIGEPLSLALENVAILWWAFPPEN